MSAADLEAPRALRHPGDTDAVTFSWADASAGLYGLARVAGGAGADGGASASALAIAFVERETLGAIAVAGDEPPGELTAVTEAPLERWSVRADGDLQLALTFEALTPPAEYGGRQALVKAGGMEGYEQLCRVRGTVRAGGRDRPLRGLGQRGHSWGNPDWDRISLTRAVGAWFDDGSGVAIAHRPARPRRSTTPTRPPGARRWHPSARARSTRSASRPRPTRPAARSAPASSCGSTPTTSTPTAAPARS